MSRNLILVSTFIAAMILIISTFSCRHEKVLTDKPEIESAVSGQTSWVKDYDSIGELCSESAIIAVGVIGRVVEVIQEKKNLYFTRFAFRIEQVLKGEENEEVIIYHTGAPDRPGSGLADDPLFEVGEEYLLFLKLSESGRYFHPGPWGRYKIIDGMVYSMNHILRDSQYQAPPQLDFNGVAINTFIEHINVVLGAVR